MGNNVIIECSCQQSDFWTIFLSLVTIAVAIWVPWRIAVKQNKIALFETRLKCYRTLNSIKSFYTFVSEITTFEENHDSKAEVHSPIENCRGKYLEIHDLLSDDKAMSQIRSSTFWKNIFIKDCIHLDCEAICSGAFLTKAITLDDAERIGKALHEFVVALFDTGKMAIITEKREALTKDSAEICKLVHALSKELEV